MTDVTDTHKDRIHSRLIKILNDLDARKKYGYTDYDDRNYYVIRDIELLYNNPDDYYRPILVNHAFSKNYEFYMCRGDETKELSLKQYIDKVISYFSELINEKKNDNQKIQLEIGINFKHIVDIEKKYTFHVNSKNIEILPGDDVNDIIKELTDSFYKNYEERLLILKNGSGYVYDNVEVLAIRFHKMEIKRGSSYIESPEWRKNKKAAIKP